MRRELPVDDSHQASWISCQVTDWLAYGGMRFPLAMGAVVLGVPTTFHTPDSGQVSPVRAVVPMGMAAPFGRSVSPTAEIRRTV